MTLAYDSALFVYNLALFPIVFFSVLFMILTLINVFVDRTPKKRYPKLKELPFITVQIPTFNDPIAERCLKHCMDFDYPKDKYEIMIVDDSTNPETQKILKTYADENPGWIRYFHRTNRKGFKPGALKEATPHAKGDILVLFDADWIPGKRFLKKIVKPFADPKVAIVQARQGFYNKDTNLITRFAVYILMAYHTIIMPINNKLNCVLFCGTAGAIRKSAFDEVGGWNDKSITEDSELSLKILLKGYNTVYLNFETPSEVPDTFESFIKQQMRWCYGNARVFLDNAGKILFGKGLSIGQRVMITYFTMGNIAAPLVVIMTFFGMSGWFLGEPTLFHVSDLWELIASFAYTAGFFLMGTFTLHKHGLLKETKYLIASIFTVGIVISIANSVAFLKAALGQKLHWFCTPKIDNKQVVK